MMTRPKPHIGIVVLLALVAPILFAFCWHDGIAAMDDSVSYILMARSISPFGGDPLSLPWAGYFSHFPPALPMLLALTGGAWNFLVAHLVVAACSLAALALIHAYGVLRLDSRAAGLGLVVVFLVMPTCWIGALGILSEPLFLALTLAAILMQERNDPGRLRNGIALGLLLALVLLTRIAGVALVAAYGAQMAIRAINRRRLPAPAELVALLLPVAAELAWLAVRPALAAPGYQSDLGTLAGFWSEHPAYMAGLSSKVLNDAWIASFAADGSGPWSITIILWAVAALGVVGIARGLMRNRLDSWYAFAGLAILFFWVYDEINQRRLLYPLVPLVLAHAAEALGAATGRMKDVRARSAAMLTGAAFVAVVCLPAIALVAKKSMDRAPLFAGSGYDLSSMTRYYTTVDVAAARSLARQEAAVLAGMSAIGKVTAPDARVMWTRPEYVAVLGRRTGEASYSSWDRATFARELQRTGTTHVAVSRVVMSDLDHHGGEAFARLAGSADFLHPVHVIQDPASGIVEFALLEVDRAALQRVTGDAKGG